MLVLSRKCTEQLIIDDNIEITVLSIERNYVRLGIRAPANVPVWREEIAPAKPVRPESRILLQRVPLKYKTVVYWWHGGTLCSGAFNRYTRNAAKIFDIYELAPEITEPNPNIESGHWTPLKVRDPRSRNITVSAELFSKLDDALANRPHG